MRKRLLALGFVAALVVGATLPATALAGHGGTTDPFPKVTVCHPTGSASNPWVETTVSGNTRNGHRVPDGGFLVSEAQPCPPIEG